MDGSTEDEWGWFHLVNETSESSDNVHRLVR